MQFQGFFMLGSCFSYFLYAFSFFFNFVEELIFLVHFLLLGYLDIFVLKNKLTYPIQSEGGFDAPALIQDQDDLNRWGLAKSVLRAIDTTPDAWSIRIALYGKWGTGKTSVLNFIEQQIKTREKQRAKSNSGSKIIVVRFSAWNVSAPDEVVFRFYHELAARVRLQGNLLFYAFRQVKRLLHKLLKAISSFAEALAGFFSSPLEPISSGTISVMRSAVNQAVTWTAIDKKDLARLQHELNGYRVVVFIDDLDRADPAVIPKTMLALRELLDWPKFAFVLAFDLEVVSSALSNYSPIFGRDARRFLEKIIDVQMVVPEPTEAEMVAMGRRLLADCADFIPPQAIEHALEWLPRNPRLVKVIVRDLGLLRNVGKRHKDSELNWKAIILHTILKHEAPKTMLEVYPSLLGNDQVVREKNTAGGASDAIKHAVSLSLEKNASEDSVPFKALFEKVVALQSLRKLESQQHIRYEMDLLIKEPSFTLLEFEAALEAWLVSKKGSCVSEIIKSGCDAGHERAPDIAKRMLVVTMMRLVEEAALAANEEDRIAYDRQIIRATAYMDFLNYLFVSCEQPDLKRVVSDFSVWRQLSLAAANMHRFEKHLENDELICRAESLLYSQALICNSPVEVMNYSVVNFREAESKSYYFAPRTITMYERVAVDMSNEAVADIIRCFYVSGGIAEAYKGAEHVNQMRRLRLIKLSSPLYTEQGLEKTVEAFHTGVDDYVERIIFADNIIVFLEGLMDLSRTCEFSEEEHLKHVISVVVPPAWQAILAGRSNNRRPKYLLKKQEDFVLGGFNVDWMPLTAEQPE
ncbi:KAP family NTPase [Pseudomonas sp. BIGb0164]|uniref:KAP family P-loop NTPase fold protein n=1 Tax=Pseudomonas sp. BIGb0164 TaxID=2940605 RepID=UPI0021688C9E|nr:KAP family NTPase [Pseudomonas sp. BIGb0164]MCS4245966.1 hypothetical protein [Pseudomonas sp. BIGb0164]